MVKSSSIPPVFDVEIGRRIVVNSDSTRGHFTVHGEVIYVSNHHFRVSVDTRVPKGALVAKQDVRISIEGKRDIVPVVTRFIRFLDESERVLVLGIPEGSWKKNRRAFFRGNIDAHVTIVREDNSRAKATAVNISGGGVLIQTTTTLKKNEEIGIIMDFDDADRIAARVRVVRIDTHDEEIRYGVKFLQIRRRDQDRICRMVIVQEFETRRNEIRELNENVPFRQ